MKNSMIQWFVCLFKKGMNEYSENQRQKKKMFRSIRKSNHQEGKNKNELHSGSSTR